MAEVSFAHDSGGPIRDRVDPIPRDLGFPKSDDPVEGHSPGPLTWSVHQPEI